MDLLVIVKRTVLLCLVLCQLAGCKPKYEMEYYDTGVVKSKKSKKDGIYIGDFFTYYPDGTLESKGEWTNGEGNGYAEKYFQNGSIKQRATYKNDKLDGYAEVYHDNGRIQLKATFVNGEKVGEYRIYSYDGKLTEFHLYDKIGRVYYITKWNTERQKITELIFPLFDAIDRGDSLTLQTHMLVKYEGKGKVTIGYKKGNVISAVIPPITLSDTIPVVTMLAKEYPLLDLYYLFDFQPAPGDSLPSLLFDFPLLRGMKRDGAEAL